MKDWFYVIAAFDLLQDSSAGLQFFHFRIQAEDEEHAYTVGMCRYWIVVKNKLENYDVVLNDYVIEI